MPLSPEINDGLTPLQRLFTAPTWRRVQVLMAGTLLARGRRTVTAALRQMGLGDAAEFSLSHQVLNRARWSALEGSRRLRGLLVRTFIHVGGSLTFVIDETLERRWGRRIRKRGHCRDSLASSTQRSGATSGLRWIVLTLVMTPVIRKNFISVGIGAADLPTLASDMIGLHAAAREFSKLFKHRVQDPALTVPMRS